MLNFTLVLRTDERDFIINVAYINWLDTGRIAHSKLCTMYFCPIHYRSYGNVKALMLTRLFVLFPRVFSTV